MDRTQMTLAERLNNERRRAGLTFAELAERVGVAAATAKAWCGARGQVPDREHRRKLAAVLRPHQEADRAVAALFGPYVL